MHEAERQPSSPWHTGPDHILRARTSAPWNQYDTAGKSQNLDVANISVSVPQTHRPKNVCLDFEANQMSLENFRKETNKEDMRLKYM